MRKVARLLKEKIPTFGRLLFYSQHDFFFVKYAMEFPYWLNLGWLLSLRVYLFVGFLHSRT